MEHHLFRITTNISHLPYQQLSAAAGVLTTVLGIRWRSIAAIIAGVALIALSLYAYFRGPVVQQNLPTKTQAEATLSRHPLTPSSAPALTSQQVTQILRDRTQVTLHPTPGASASYLAAPFYFFFGNCDKDLPNGREDLGWGCAWRSIQTCLSRSHFDHIQSFEPLFKAYKRTSCLREWAEPGYGKRICDALTVPCKLALYNRSKGSDKTPTDQCEKMASFEALKSALIAHFQAYQTPVMIDDECLACCIVGIEIIPGNETLLRIADPHKISKEAGLYTLVIDNKGRKIRSTGIDDNTNGLRTAQTVSSERGWMLFFPQPRTNAIYQKKL